MDDLHQGYGVGGKRCNRERMLACRIVLFCSSSIIITAIIGRA